MMTQANDEEYDWLFGFGSIINTATHAPWLKAANNEDQEVEPLPGIVVTLKSNFGYQRCWNFRSTTGFTALGLISIQNHRKTGDDTDLGINGVVFRIERKMIPKFDVREVGYDRIRIPVEYLKVEEYPDRPESNMRRSNLQLTSEDRIWIYVPQPSQCSLADENFPLLQSYVDTVLQGCLEWGGEKMVEDFILSTGGWSTFFLNDTPSSRRPWLFRKEYNTIDGLLQKHSEKTHFADRRHPEEFASAMMKLRMKGTWSIPRRNKNFTGRDHELEQLRSRLSNQDHGRQRAAVKVVEVAGMGGVGKTQLVTEYCYRNFPSQYGLVIWLNAESSEALVSDYKQLLADLVDESDSNPDKDTEEIVREVKTRLFRSQTPWLLVFDNLEDRKLLENFMPKGAGQIGHIVVTTRLVEVELGDESSDSLILGCFSPQESIDLLKRAAGPRNMDGTSNTEAAKEVAEFLGHLPLALVMAASYMSRCDVTCHEYLGRYIASEQEGQSLLRHGKIQDYSLTVASSLSLSLKAIEKESVVACDISRLLCFLGPDQITKSLLRHLLSWKNKAEQEPEILAVTTPLFSKRLTIFMTGGLVLTSCTLMGASRQSAALLALASLSVASVLAMSDIVTFQTEIEEKEEPHSFSRSSSFVFSAVEYEQADLVWDILKSYSLLSVKEGKGNIHRLLAQALRASQTETEGQFNLKVCLNLMWSLWKFQPEQIESWNESLQILEHAKSVVSHFLAYDFGSNYTLKAARLSCQVGMFSAMALNAFMEAQASLELSIKLLDRCKEMKMHPTFKKARGQALYELGRILRYEGPLKYEASERLLLSALKIYEDLNLRSPVAETLHELGVLEVKRHNLDSAASFLQKSLDMCRTSSTLHQLAAVHVARKPAQLKKAKKLLQEALGLSKQIGQRAATLKQLARVTMREGSLDLAKTYLEQALELYLELYGDNKLHINVAACKFQQGALAFQHEQFEQAWLHFSECLRIRRHVYSYARPIGSKKEDNPTHLEISCVLHELGRVAFAQGRYETATDILKSERLILERLVETAAQSERLFQARLTNLTWSLKCARELGSEEDVTQLTLDKARMKKVRGGKQSEQTLDVQSDALALQALECRDLSRRFALQKREGSIAEKQQILACLADLQKEIHKNNSAGSMKSSCIEFRKVVLQWIDKPCGDRRGPILQACDDLRNVLRSLGIQVYDDFTSKKNKS